MKSTILGALLFLFAAPTVSHCSATVVIYNNNAAPNQAGTSDAGDPTFLIRADDFILATGATTVIGVEWTGQYAGNIVHVTDDFTIQFFENDLPGESQQFNEPENVSSAILTIDVANANRTAIGGSRYHYSASVVIDPLLFQAGDRYWISIFNDATDEERDWRWAMQDLAPITNIAASRGSTADTWGSEIGRIMDFQLLGPTAIPEATSFLLVGCLGLASILLVWTARKVPSHAQQLTRAGTLLARGVPRVDAEAQD